VNEAMSRGRAAVRSERSRPPNGTGGDSDI
jgi:hypothetical protein